MKWGKLWLQLFLTIIGLFFTILFIVFISRAMRTGGITFLIFNDYGEMYWEFGLLWVVLILYLIFSIITIKEIIRG